MIRLCLFLSILVSIQVSAETAAITADVRENAFYQWAGAFVQTSQPIECKHVKDVPGTYVCLTRSRDLLQKMFSRASFAIENSAQSVLPHNSRMLVTSRQWTYVGHDLRATDLMTFFQQADQLCSIDSSYCLNEEERSLRDQVLASANQRKFENPVVIGVPATNGGLFMLSHEMLHARFFLKSKYARIVSDFWKKRVNAEDKRGIEFALSRLYNVKDENLLINEFQAYVLQDAPEFGLLPGFAKKYGSALRARLSR